MSEAQWLSGDATLLRVFLGNHDVHGGRLVYEVIVEAARQAGLAGATVLSGFMGFGATSVVHRPHLFRLSQDLPVVIEMVDEDAKIRAFLPRLEELLSGGGLITLEVLTVLHYQAATPATQESP